MIDQHPRGRVNAAAGIGAEAVDDLPYECPDCGEPHDGMATGTERCPGCQEDDQCEGHESLDGAHMGESVYCDGSCRRAAKRGRRSRRE